MLKYDIVTRHADSTNASIDASLRYNHILDNEKLAELLAQRCNQDKAPILAVLKQLPKLMMERINDGDSVQLDGLFAMGLQMECFPVDKRTLMCDAPEPKSAEYNPAILMIHLHENWAFTDWNVNQHYVPYRPYPVPVRIEFLGSEQDTIDFGEINAPMDSKALFHWTVGYTNGINSTESIDSELTAVDKQTLLVEYKGIWHTASMLEEQGKLPYQVSQIGQGLSREEKSAGCAQLIVQEDSNFLLGVFVDECFPPPPEEMEATVLGQEANSPDERTTLYSLSGETVESVMPLLRHFASHIKQGVWEQNGLTATLRKPHEMPFLSPEYIDLHFVNIFLGWGTEVIARAQSPKYRTPLANWKNPLGLKGIGELDENKACISCWDE